jgi:hypothetical protein
MAEETLEILKSKISTIDILTEISEKLKKTIEKERKEVEEWLIKKCNENCNHKNNGGFVEWCWRDLCDGKLYCYNRLSTYEICQNCKKISVELKKSYDIEKDINCKNCEK